jgi:hypothetical protein
MLRLLHVYYDTRLAPLTFDFGSYLVVANAERQARGLGGLALHILRPGFRNRTQRETMYSEDTKEWRFRHIILSLTSLLDSVSSVEWNKLGPDTIAFPSFPSTYPPRAKHELLNSIPYLSNSLFKYRGTSVDLLPFYSKPHATDISRALLKPRQNTPVITITLRTSNQQLERNSCLENWYQVYSVLVKRGYQVCVIPDFEDVVDKRDYLRYPWDIFLPAVFDMQIRLGVYSLAQINLGVLNGVLVPLFHSPYPYLIFKPNVESIPQTNTKWLKDVFGIERGETFWWARADQRLCWDLDDSSEKMLEVITELLL